MTGGPDRRGTPARGGTLRAAALAALSALITAVGHVAGGGTLPDLAVLAVLLPMVAAVFLSFARRCRGAVGTVAALAAGQVTLHQLMTLLHPPHVTEPAALAGPAMLGMHAAVTLVLAGALLHAERGVSAFAAALRRMVRRRLVPLPADRPLPTLAVPGSGLPALLARVLAVAHARRGPPVGC